MRSGFRTSAVAWLAAGCVASLLSCLRGAPDSATPSGTDPVSSAEPPRASTGGDTRSAALPPGSGDNLGSAASVAVGPARLFPDVAVNSPGVVSVEPDGSRRIIVAGIRVLDHPDGSLQRAREVLPNGMPRVVTVPSRLGGGLLVYVPAGGSTQIWRAKGWLDRLEPLAEIWGTVGEIVPGFDRLYARLTSGDIKAIDVASGHQMSLGPLPRATRIGQLAFADAWRGVAVVDFRGALATFDAGMTWRSIPIGEQSVTQVALRNGDFLLDAARQRTILGPRGELDREELREPPRAREATAGLGDVTPGASLPFEALVRRAGGDAIGFGRRPLRAAIEDGWPDGVDSRGAPTAVIAHGGALHRIELRGGAVVASRSGALREEDGACHAVAVGQGFGFVCGAPKGTTAVYAFAPPFELRPLARFTRPRMVIPSGSGGFVVRGRCARDAVSTSASNDVFCFFNANGEEREVKAPAGDKRESASLYPVALADGRALFVVPPEGEGPGKLLVSQGKGFAAVPWVSGPNQALFRRGAFLDGFEERAPGVLGGWVLAGTELRGVRIGLDGKVEVGRVTTNIERTVAAGRFALEWGRGGRGIETIDGGMTFRPVDLSQTDLPAPSRAVAACGPVGCTQGGWLRVGWGGAPEAPDLVTAPTPKPSRVTLASPRGLALHCYPTGEVSGPAPKPSGRPAPVGIKAVPPSRKPAVPAPPIATVRPALPPGVFPPTRLPPIFAPTPTRPNPVASPAAPSANPWNPFRGEAPPSLAASDVGLEAGTDPPLTMQARIYTWGARGSEWSLKGHVLARFDDRFDRLGTRSTLATPSPWSGEERAGDALGLTAGQSVNWTALLDGSGQAALIVGQRSASKADLYAAALGQPLVVLHDPDRAPLPLPNSVVRIGSTWFFLVSTMTPTTWAATLYRADGGVVRRLARLPRIPVPAGEFAPKLMRRSQSQGLGILVQGAPGFDQVIRDWYVLPLDPETGEMDEPVRLFGSDLEGAIPERCASDRDGWVVNTDLSFAPAVQVVAPGQMNVSAIELRLRLDPGVVCVDAMAARVEGLAMGQPGVASRAVTPPDGALPDLPLAATDPSSGRRMLLRCGK